MNRGKVSALLGLLLVATLVVASQAWSASGGIGKSTTPALPPAGCNCHGEGGHDGKPSAEVTPILTIEGAAVAYKPNQVYNVTVTSTGGPAPSTVEGSNKGGFNLKVNVGTLAAGAGYEKWVQILGTTEATHTKDGDVLANRHFNLTWKAPGAAEEPAIFTLWVNNVDGSGSNDGGDRFNGITIAFLNEPGAVLGAGAHAVNPEHIGVNWLAHWVGIVSFVAVILTLLIYYFVLKFGETIHTVDNRDRKEK